MSAIPAGAPSEGVLSTSCPLIGESNVKGDGVLDDSGVEFTKNSASAPLLTNSDLACCDPAGIADILVEDKVLIEVKAVEKNHLIYETQVLTYLRLTGIKLGLLINFGAPYVKDGISRIINGVL
jgi:GxxExxY protein